MNGQKDVLCQRRIVGSEAEPKYIGSREEIRPSAWIGSACLDGEDPGEEWDPYG